MLLARWIVRNVPLEIDRSSGHEKVPTCGKPGLERPGRPRGERIENYYNANNEDNINVKNNKGLDQISDSPEADLKRLFNPAMVVEDTVPKQTSEQWEI
ncbi:hypothetical protein TNCV_1227401 [Trichonephila clavipes]|nr:hypothetical protein TNCV_1227401 [Trichonephila clavipes]